jgi:hypothetical protein
MVSNIHAAMVHRIAQLAFFCYSLLILSGLVCSISHMVLVGNYHYLSCYETDQDDPGENDMLIAFFQNHNVQLLQK